jgi:hypothetical protein
MSELRTKINKNITIGIKQNLISNNDLLQIIEHCEDYLNLKTISDYAKENNMSYNGVKHHRKLVKLFGITFVQEND